MSAVSGIDEQRLTEDCRSALSQLYSLATSVISEAYIPDGTGGPFEQPNVVRHREHHQLAFEHS